MTILIDKPIWPFRGERWSHLVSDLSYEELHDFRTQLHSRLQLAGELARELAGELAGESADLRSR